MKMTRRSTDLPELVQGEPDRTEPRVQQFISFTLVNQEYGLDIMKVREIKAWNGTTRLPNSPDYMRGVINLRGSIVPVIDLGKRFGVGEATVTSASVIIIVAHGGTQTGLLVDAVSDIITVGHSEISPIPEMGTELANPFFSGIVNVQDKLLAIVALEELLGDDADNIANAPTHSLRDGNSQNSNEFLMRL